MQSILVRREEVDHCVLRWWWGRPRQRVLGRRTRRHSVGGQRRWFRRGVDSLHRSRAAVIAAWQKLRREGVVSRPGRSEEVEARSNARVVQPVISSVREMLIQRGVTGAGRSVELHRIRGEDAEDSDTHELAEPLPTSLGSGSTRRQQPLVQTGGGRPSRVSSSGDPLFSPPQQRPGASRGVLCSLSNFVLRCCWFCGSSDRYQPTD